LAHRSSSTTARWRRHARCVRKASALCSLTTTPRRCRPTTMRATGCTLRSCRSRECLTSTRSRRRAASSYRWAVRSRRISHCHSHVPVPTCSARRPTISIAQRIARSSRHCSIVCRSISRPGAQRRASTLRASSPLTSATRCSFGPRTCSRAPPWRSRTRLSTCSIC
jgi:hypothetical protein